MNCKNNEVPTCKFIDCLNTQTINQEEVSKYLFSACIPIAFSVQQATYICQTVGEGNDYRDYKVNNDDIT